MKIKTTYLLTTLFIGVFIIVSCNNESKKQAKTNVALNNSADEIDKKYIEYLNEYSSGNNPEINFITIGEITYWVTHYQESGSRQEYFWVLNENKLIPKFIFEYGGMDWDKELDYTFIDIEENKTIEGKAFENDMEEAKEKFILKSKPNGLENHSEQISTPQQKNENTVVEDSKNNPSLKTTQEVELTLTDATLKKALLYLGKPDKEERGFGHLTKGYAIYFNKVSDNGQTKNLVLFLRMNGNFWGNNANVEEIYSVGENEKTCFGIHCLSIVNGEINTN